MDQTDHLSQFTTSKFIMKTTKLMLLSVSLFFILFSYSSSLPCFFLQLLSHAMNKKCIFLICNGIVVFLVESLGFFIKFSPENNLNNVQLFTKIGDHGKGSPSLLDTIFSLLSRLVSPQEEGEDTKVSLFEREVSPWEEEESSELGKSEDSKLIEEEEGGHFDVQNALPCTLHNEFPQSEGGEHAIEEEEENELWITGVGIEEDQEEEEEGGGGRGNGLEISREELNKKCDEFIRRMKEEIRIGAQNYY